MLARLSYLVGIFNPALRRWWESVPLGHKIGPWADLRGETAGARPRFRRQREVGGGLPGRHILNQFRTNGFIDQLCK